MKAIEIRDLTVVRGKTTVLTDVSLDLPRGSVTGLLGPSGCGKTTLIRTIAGVQVVTSGSVSVLGEPAGNLHNRTRVGYVTQASSVYPDLTVRQNVEYFARLVSAAPERVNEVVRNVDLTAQADTLTGSLSGGQRTRVSLAAALTGDPDVYLLDEPTVGLDPVLRRDLWRMFRSLAAQGKTLLISSHVMDEAARCDRVLLMREGQLIADDSPEGLLATTGAADMEAAFLALAEGVDA
jgi:ABC-2 type transport system ATP-binding protein